MRTLLAAVVVIGLAAVAGAVIVGVRVFDGTVAENPYERGLAWDRERKEAAGLQVDLVGRSFRTGDNLVAFRVLDRGRPFEGPSITVERTRPSTSSYDRTHAALRGVDGLFRVMVDFPVEGHWDLIAVLERGGGPLRFHHAVYAQTKERVTPPPPCDLDRGPCVANLDGSGAEVAFDVTPKPLKTMTSLEFSVATGDGDDGEEVTVRLSMPGMYMGKNTVRLRRAGAGLWKGEGVIVRCPSGERVWLATVTVRGRGTADFTFEVDR